MPAKIAHQPLRGHRRRSPVSWVMGLAVFFLGSLANGQESNSTGYTDSGGFALDTQYVQNLGFAESSGFTLDTEEVQGLATPGTGVSSGFVLDTQGAVNPASVDLNQTGFADSGGFTVDTSNGTASPADSNQSGFEDSGGFTVDTQDPNPNENTGHNDSGGFVLNTGGNDGSSQTGHSDSGGFGLDTRDNLNPATDPDATGFEDSGGFTLDTIGSGGNPPIANTPPTDLNSTAPLTVAENQPVGTIVGEFNATDPDVNSTLTYYFVNGVADNNNSLFTLETNGTLKTATVFDYENNASSYSIRVLAKDDKNASVEGNFSIALTNVDDLPKFKLVRGMEGFEVPSQDGLIGEWLFDDDSVNDSSGNGYHGTWVGTAEYITETPTGVGKAINLNGNKYVKVDDGSDQSTFNGGNAFTLSAWVKESPDGAYEPWVSKRGESGQGWQLRRGGPSEQLNFITYGPSNGIFMLQYTLPDWDDTKWYHLAAVHGADEGLKQKIYVDGALITEQNRTGEVSGDHHMLVFGAQHNNNSFFEQSNVYMDDIRFYNRALSQSEIQVHTGNVLNKFEGTVGTITNFQIVATNGPVAFSVDPEGWPAGLSINSATGDISGMAMQAGDFNATVNVHNSNGMTSKTIYFRIARAPQTLTWNQNFAGLTYGDSNLTFNATSSNGENVVYGSSDPSVIEINGTSMVQPIVENGLVWYWNFDDDLNGSANVVNATIGGLHGTKGSGVTVVAGKFGNALSFDGSSDDASKVDFGTDSRGDFDGIFSLSFWVKPTSAGNVNLIDNKSASTSPGFQIYLTSSSNRLYVRGTTTMRYLTINGTNWNLPNWVHLVNTFDDQSSNSAEKWKMYADGILIGQNNIPQIEPGSANLFFGRSPAGGKRFTGQMDDVRFYDRVLSESEVSTLYGSGNGDLVTMQTGNSATIKKAGLVTLSSYSPGNNNYLGATPISKMAIIAKAPLTVTGNNYSIYTGNPIPAMSYTSTGWKNGDSNTTAFLTPISMTTNATNTNSAGTFYVRPGGAASEKYIFNYVDGQLVISNKTPQSIVWDPDFSTTAINQVVDLNASSSANLPIVYQVSDTSVAELAVTRQSSLDAWWKLDENSSTTLADSTGSGASIHSAVLIGTDGSTNWSTGKFGNALSLDGVNDYGFAVGYKGITGTSRRSLSLWFKTSIPDQAILQYGAAGTGTLFKISLNGSGAAMVDLGGSTITAGNGLANTTWHHLAVTVPENGDSSGVKFYVDGNLTSGSGAIPINTGSANDLKIGTDGSSLFDGQLDDIRLYNAELNASTISQIYGSGLGDFNRLLLKSAGSITITASQSGDSAHSEAEDVNATLVLNHLNQMISFPPISDKSIGDFDFDPGASVDSGLPISYTSSDPLVASIEGSTPGNQKIKIRSAGAVTITANQPGDLVFAQAPESNQTFTVGYENFFADALPGLRLWLDSNNINADSNPNTENNGSSVMQWKDLSTSTNHAVQANGSNRPFYVSNGLNGMGVLSFTEGQTLEITADSSIRTIAAVLKQSPAQVAQSKPFGGDQYLTSATGMIGLGSISTEISSSQSFRIVVWQFSPNNHSLYVLGHDKGTNSAGIAPAPFDKVGNDFAGEIAEVLAFDQALSDTIRKKIEGYLAHKWGLANGLMGGHTYKMNRPSFGGTQTLSFEPFSMITIGQSTTPAVTSDSGLSSFSFDSNDTSIVSFSGNVASALAPGQVRITATEPGNSNWLPGNAYQDWIVSSIPKADQNISFAIIPDKHALSPDFILEANASSGLPVSFVSLNPVIATVEENGTVSILSPGIATFRASQDGNSSVNPAPVMEQNMTVSKAPQSITFGAIPPQTLSAGTYSLSGSSSSGLGLSYSTSDQSIANITGNVVTFLQSGNVSIIASQNGNPIYNAALAVSQNLSIIDDTLQPQTITWSQNLSTLTYGSADINLTASSSSTLPVIYTSSDSSVVDINGTFIKIKGAGTVTISASQSGNGQYQPAAPVDKNVTVNKANQTIVTNLGSLTLPDITMDSGDFEFSPDIKSVKAGTISNTGLSLSFTSSVSNVIQVTGGGTRLKPVGGGIATITVSQAGNFGYNPASSKTFTVTITEYSPYSNSLPGMIFWLNGYDVNGDGFPDTNSDFTNVGGKVQPSVWADISGGFNSFSQSSIALQPVYVVEGGKPGMAFGSNLGNMGAYLSGVAPSIINGNAGYTLVMAAKTNGTSGERIFHLGAISGTAGQVIGHGVNGGFYFNGGGQKTFSGVNLGGEVQVGVFRRKAGSTYADSEFMLNGSNEIGTAISGASMPSIPSTGRDMILGAGRNESGSIAQQLDNAILHEVMLFSGDLDDFAIRRLEGYLAYKWGASARLTNGHPFGSNRPLFGGSQSISVAANNVPLDAEDNTKPFMSIFDGQFVLEGSYATSGLPLIYETNNSSVLSVNSSGKLAPVGTGLVRITIKQPGDNHFSPASDQFFDMKIIGKQPQTLSFSTASETVINQPMALNASSSAGLTVSYSVIAGGNIANLSNNQLTFSGTGSVTVRASQGGNGTYAAAVAVDQTFMVKKPTSIVFDPVGDMGRNQIFQINASVLDGITNQHLQISPTYSIISGPASISGSLITCGNSTGVVTVRAVASGSDFFTSSSITTFNVTNKQGQTISFKHQETGGLRDLMLSPKSIPVGQMATSSSNLPLSFSLTSNPSGVMQMLGNGENALLAFSQNFTGFGGAEELSVSIRATQSGNATYNGAAAVNRTIKIQKPGKNAFYNERRYDSRYEIEKAKFARKLFAKRALHGLIDLNGDGSISPLDAALLFDSDTYDSDGDGVNNFLERALGGDSLFNDRLDILPQTINIGDGKQRLSFRQYQAQYNSEGIEYIVERSVDGMTWSTSGINQVDLNGPGSPGKGVTLAGGMERVLFETTQSTAQAGGRQFIRLRIRSKESSSLANALPGEGEISATMATEGMAQLSSGTLGKPIYAGQVTNVTTTTVSFEPTFNSSELPINPFTPGVFNSSVKTPTLTASLTGAGLGSISISNAGSGFSTPPQIVIDPPTSGNDQATAIATLNGTGGIASITLTSSGSGYSVPPKIRVLGGPHFVRLSEKGDSNEGRIFLITDNNATRLTLDLSRLVPGETLQNILQTEYSVEIVPAITLGSILGTTANEIPLTGGSPSDADFIYLWHKTAQFYTPLFFLTPAVGSYQEGWYNRYSTQAGLMNDLVLYPDESMLIAKRNSGPSSFTSMVYLGNPVQFELPETASYSRLNSSSKILGQLVPNHSVGNGPSDFRTGSNETDNNADKISMFDGTSWSDFYYQSGINDGVTNGARATARAGTASGNGMSDSDVSIASGTITSLQSCTATGNTSIDHIQSEHTLITLNGNAPLSGFTISLNGIYGKKINQDGTMELDLNGSEVSMGGGITVASGLTGSFEIIARPNSSKIVIAQKRDVNLDSSKGAKSWSTGQGGSGYNTNAKAYFLGGGHSTMAVATASVTGGMVVGFDFSGNGNSRGAGYTSSPKVFISGGGWRKTGLPNIPQDGEVVLPSFVTRNNPSGQSSYFLPENQFQGELLSGMREGQDPTSLDMFFNGLGNTSPTDLNSTAPLTFSENQPIGSVVGEFNATDPDNNAVLTYHLVSGTGDGNNSLFLLETNGTLKTAVPFDFESNASNYSIRVQVKDEHNASMESSFTVTLSDDQNEDTDGDGFPDGLEITHGSDPWDLSSMPNQSPTNLIAASPLYNDQKNTFAHSLQRNWLKAAENVVANALGLYPNSQKSWDIKVYDAGYPIVLFPKYVGSSMQIDEIGFGLENFNPPHTQPDSLTDLAVVAKMTELILSQNSYYSDLIGDDSNNKDSANWFKEGLGKFVRGFDEGVTPFLNNLSTDLEIDTLLASFGSAPIAQSSALSYLAVRFLHRQIAISGAPSFYGVESNLGIKHLVTWISEQFKSGQDSSNCGLNAYFNFYPSIGFSDTDSFMVNFTGSFGRVFIKNEIIPNLENSDTGSIMGSDSSNGSSLTNSEVVADANGSPLSNAIFVLDIDEDQPVGTPVATFGAFDPDGDSLVFSLTNGLGSNHNHLFSLEQNGTLKTAVIFDYEDPFTLDANSSRYSIRVAAIDDENASIERVFKFDLLNNSSDDVHEVTFSLNGISSDSQAWDRLGNLSNPPSGWSVSNSNFYEFDLDTYSTSGKFILEVNSGGNGERYILLQDSDVIFDTAGGPMSDMKWSTAGSSYKYDYDRFEIIYYPGMDTLFKFVPLSLGDSTDIRGSDRAMGTGDDLLPADNGLFDNKSDYIEQLGLGTSDGDIAQPWNAGDDYSNIRFYGGVGEVGTYPSSGSSTKLTLRVEADSIFVLNAYYEPLTNYPPSDLNSTGTLTIAENQPIGTIVGEFNANDPDVDATLSFSLVEGHGSINNALFSLETNGTLKTAVPFDFESNASNYTIRVQVKDEHNASAESQFVIGLLNEVEDLDGDGIEDHYDNDDDGDGFSDAEEIAYGSDPRDPTSVANQLPTALTSPPSLSILENQPAGTMIGQFSANDPDANTTLTFSMVQGTIALHLFDLDQDGDLEILTEDLTGNFSVNQNLGSSFTQRNNLSLPGHTAIQSNNNLFSLSSDGILRSMVTFDFESDPVQFLVQVQVRDEHNASISQTFTVDLHNTNEAPNNLDFTGSLSFLENQPAGTLIGKFTASDPDINSTLNYQLVDDIGGEHHSPFILDPNGSLFTASTLDYESTHSAFALHVRVSDEYNSGTEGNFTVSLINDVEDWDGDGVEDHYDSDDDNDGFNDAVEIAFGSDPRDSLSLANTPPVFVQGPTFFIPENEPIGTTVASISALDPDNNSSVPVVMNSPSSAFSYDFNQTIRTAEIFDFEANHTSFSLLFSATDEFNATTNHEIIIEVTNVVEDMDNDGFEDAFDLDIDGDGLENTLEISTGTDPLKPDTDEDGLLDGMEYSMGSNPLNMDTDYDGLTDKAEYEIGTNPLLDDTDLDGFKDQEELLAFTSPEDANDYPGNSSLKSHNEAPDGKFYELITEGHSLEEAKELAKNKGADLPYLTHHKSELNKFLIQLLIRSQIDSAWALGDKSFLPWYIKRNNPLMLFTSTRGFSYSYAIGESTKLPVLLVREKSAVQKAVVLTLPPEINSQTVLAKGQILDSGGDKPFRVGFRISEKIMVRDSDTTARMISGISNQDTFQATIERLTPGKSYYVRAFAENSAGLKYGSVRKIKVEKTYLAPFDASALSDNWYNSVWFGAFKHYETKWIFHNELGWLYHGPVGGNGIWFWTQKRGWLWTVEQVWPYLWQHESANWLYYLKQEDQAGLYFDFSLGQYTD